MCCSERTVTDQKSSEVSRVEVNVFSIKAA
jgi:hypothetical protein